jgi:PAP2 superfamily protein
MKRTPSALALTALLFFISASSAADEVAAWRPWLAQNAVAADPSPTFPASLELAALARQRALVERWVRTAPSLAWGDVVAELVVKYQQTPLRAARNFAYVHVAIHDALVRCARAGCDATLRPIAMHAAASRVLAHLYPDESAGRLEALGLTAAATVLAASGEAPQAALAWQTGRAVAASAIRRALYDGWDLPRLPASRPAWKPGVWRAAPPLNIYDPLEPGAARWRTWVLASGAEIEPPPPPDYGSPAYWADVEEVRAVAKALTAEQKRIADEWNLGLGSVTPPGVWNLRAKALVLEHGLDAAHAAQVFAALNTGVLDAMVACWHAKYKWWTERPITVIRAERDAGFTPYLVTPGFPSYVSGHASASGAAAAVLSAFFPQDATALQAMAEEAAMSRLYGGIHFRSDNEQGLVLGRKVGARAVERARALEAAQSAASTR